MCKVWIASNRFSRLRLMYPKLANRWYKVSYLYALWYLVLLLQLGDFMPQCSSTSLDLTHYVFPGIRRISRLNTTRFHCMECCAKPDLSSVTSKICSGNEIQNHRYTWFVGLEYMLNQYLARINLSIGHLQWKQRQPCRRFMKTCVSKCVIIMLTAMLGSTQLPKNLWTHN